MDLKKLLKEKKLTSRQLSDLCQIPYSTVNDIINGKRNLAKCTAETVWKLAKQLDLSMEELLIQEEKKLTLDNDTFENTGKSRFFERRTSRVLY